MFVFFLILFYIQVKTSLKYDVIFVTAKLKYSRVDWLHLN